MNPVRAIKETQHLHKWSCIGKEKMLEIIISNEELTAGLKKAQSELGDFLESTKRALRRDSADLGRMTDECIDTFVASYYAITEKIKLEQVSDQFAKTETVWKHGLCWSATAALNYLQDAIHDDFMVLPSTEIKSISGKTQFSILNNSLLDLRGYVQGAENTARRLCIFFNTIRASADHDVMAGFAQGKDPLELKPVSSGRACFSKREAGNYRNGNPVLVGDRLPDSLPEYSASSVRCCDVIGNSEALDTMTNHILKLLHYHPQSKENYMFMDGSGFPEGVLLYGEPGVGKTFTAGAVMNFALEYSRNHDVLFEAAVLNGSHIGSVYQNRSGALLEHYLSLLKKPDKARAVVIDEADDLVPLGNNGQMSENARQRLSSLKRSLGGSGSLGNIYVIMIANRISCEDDIPAEITDRLQPVFLAGPVTAEDYGRIIRSGLKEKGELNLVDSSVNWEQVGEYIMKWKEKLKSNSYHAHIGRGYKLITQQLASTTRQHMSFYADETLGKHPDFHRKFYSDKWTGINEESIYRAVDSAMNTLMQSRAGRN